jgi:hypothetical protein
MKSQQLLVLGVTPPTAILNELNIIFVAGNAMYSLFTLLHSSIVSNKGCYLSPAAFKLSIGLQ